MSDISTTPPELPTHQPVSLGKQLYGLLMSGLDYLLEGPPSVRRAIRTEDPHDLLGADVCPRISSNDAKCLRHTATSHDPDMTEYSLVIAINRPDVPFGVTANRTEYKPGKKLRGLDGKLISEKALASAYAKGKA